MKAAWYERNGAAADVLTVGEMETPEPGIGEVRVRMHTSGVNPSDVKSRRGRPLVGPRIIPHSDGAGIIEAVGKTIDHGRVGQRVWIWNGQWKRPFGTAAEYCCLPADPAVRLPAKVDAAAAACLGIPALTAIHAVRLHGKLEGRTLLVTGGGSAVGFYAIQLAKMHGARVIATASEARADHARHAGADFVVDYKHKDVAKVVKDLTKGRGVDGIIDMDMSSTAPLVAAAVMAPHGTWVCYGSNQATDIAINFPAMLWNSYALKVFVVYELRPDDRKAAIAELTGLLEAGTLTHAVAARFRLSDIVAAHEAVESGALSGNVVVDIA